MFRFGIPIKSMPKYLRKIEFRVDLYIEEIDFSFSAYSVIDERGTYWYSLFDSTLLRNLDRFELQISFRLINLMVSNGDKDMFHSSQRSSIAGMPQNVSSAPRNGGSLSFKFENFRKESATNLEKARKRISRRFTRTKAQSVHADL